jgi:hypothetical protein
LQFFVERAEEVFSVMSESSVVLSPKLPTVKGVLEPAFATQANSGRSSKEKEVEQAAV